MTDPKSGRQHMCRLWEEEKEKETHRSGRKGERVWQENLAIVSELPGELQQGCGEAPHI